MGLHHKHLILAGIASLVVAGLLSASDTSALGEFSFLNDLNSRSSLSWLLDFDSDNPFGNNCEGANPDSTISCNESSFPSILYNQDEETVDYPYWGHDSDGIIFTDTEYLTDENGNISKQLRTANYGDRIDYSIKFRAVHQPGEDQDVVADSYYLDWEEDFDSLKIDPESISMTMDGIQCPEEICSTASSGMGGYDLRFNIANVTYNNATRSYDYSRIVDDDGAEFEVTFSAILGGGILREDNMLKAQLHWSTFNTSTKQYVNDVASNSVPVFASVRMGSLVIQKEDPSGRPLAGAKFKVDNVRAMNIGGKYLYAPEYGMFTEFETNENGLAIISGLPYGDYTVTEIEAPAGYLSDETPKTISVNNSNLAQYSYSRLKAIYFREYDITDSLMKDPSGAYSLHSNAIDGMTVQGILVYNEESGSYTDEDGRIVVRKTSDDAYSYGNEEVEQAIKFDKLKDGVYSAAGNIDFGEVYRVKENADGTVTIVKEGNTETVSLDNGGCYFDEDPSSNRDGASLCKRGDVYYYMVETEGITIFIPMPFDSDKGEYRGNVSMFRMYLVETDKKDQLYFIQSGVVDYDDNLEKWWSVYMAPLTLDTEIITSGIRANGVKFVNSPIGGGIPENIPNPQTSDAVFKVAAITVLSLVPIVVIRKQFSKRGN